MAVYKLSSVKNITQKAGIFLEKIYSRMKRNTIFTSFLVFVITVLLFTITSMLMSSCTGVKYTYYNKQKVPYTAGDQTKLAKTIPANPFLTQSENTLKEKTAALGGKRSGQQNVSENPGQKKEIAPATPGKVLKEINVAKYIPKVKKSVQSSGDGNEMDRDLAILILIIAIILVIALLGDNLLWLLFLALLVLLIYVLVKYLGIFN